jgi:hypothetical protein
MKQSKADKQRILNRRWMNVFDFLRRNKWGGLPWTLHDEDWTQAELRKRNDEIDRRLNAQ